MAFIVGNCLDNTLVGTHSNDLMFGLWGDDEMHGGAGNDLMFGGSGDDTMDGGEGCDIVAGGCGDDLVLGGLGSDLVVGQWGDDILYGDTMSSGTGSGVNYVVNGSFEDTTGLQPREFGFVGEIPGWTNIGDGNPEVVNDGWVGMPASDGDYWVDTGTLFNRVIDISQQINGLTNGETYLLSFDAGQWQEPSPAPDETMNVYWNGELLANVRPETIDGYEQFSFEVTAGSGDGTNTLRFEGVPGDEGDAQGVVIDNIVITDIVEEGGDDVLKGGSGNDQLFGGGGDDILKGGSGDDINTGGSGADVFVFGKYSGTDTITDFEIGVDTIALYGACGWYCCNDTLDFSDLSFSQVGADTELGFGSTTIIVENTTATDLSEDDFWFV